MQTSTEGDDVEGMTRRMPPGTRLSQALEPEIALVPGATESDGDTAIGAQAGSESTHASEPWMARMAPIRASALTS